MTNLLSILLSTTTAQQTVEAGFFAGVMAFLLLPWVFYSILIIGTIILIALHENEEIGWSHTVFILMMAYLCYNFNIGLKDLIHNPLPLLKWIGLYLIGGIAWSFGKWFFFLKSSLSEFNENKRKKTDELKDNPLIKNNPEISNEILKELINKNLYTNYGYGSNSIKVIQGSIIKTLTILGNNKNRSTENFEIHSYSIENPQANNHKALITTWITHWPVSLVWTLINDPIKKLINHIFESIKSVFQRISDKVFESTKAEL